MAGPGGADAVGAGELGGAGELPGPGWAGPDGAAAAVAGKAAVTAVAPLTEPLPFGVDADWGTLRSVICFFTSRVTLGPATPGSGDDAR